MLGLRRYRGVQIDLFQGDSTTFVCDHAVVLAGAPKGTAADPAPALGRVDGGRHVAFAVAAELSGEQLIGAAKACIDGGGANRSLRRITFVLASLEHYHSFQEALFRLFPETDA